MKNFIGIYNGTGLGEIEIDFIKSKNMMTILLGANGSGKSTILSTLHPYAKTNNDPSSIILTGEDGFKEIHYLHDGVEYKIQHHYSNKKKTKTTKSFIQKDGVELNENGNQTSFRQIVDQELDVYEDFFRLSRIGSNVSGFIQLKPTERKQYISNFLQDIDEYLVHFKTVSDKWSAYKKDISSVVDNINKLGDISHIDSDILLYLATIARLDEEISDLKSTIDENNGIVYSMDGNGELVKEYNQLARQFKELKPIVDKLKSKIEHIEDKNNTIGYIDERDRIQHEIHRANTGLASTHDRVSNIKRELLSLYEQRTNKTEELNKYKFDRDLNEYRELLDESVRQYDECSNTISDMINENPILKRYEHVESNTFINDYHTQLNTIMDEIDSLKSTYDMDVIDMALDSEYHIISATRKSLLDMQNILRTQLRDTQDKYREKLSHARYSDILNQRPHDCKIDTCPFIMEALRYRNVDKELESLQSEIDTQQSGIDEYDKNIEMYSNVLDINGRLSRIYKTIESDRWLNSIHYFDGFDQEKFIRLVTIIHERDRYTNTEDISDFVETIRDYRTHEQSIETFKNNIALLESQRTVVELITNDIFRINSDIERLNETMIVENELIDGAQNEISQMNDRLDLVNQVIEYGEERERLLLIKNNIMDIKSQIDSIKELKNQNIEYQSNIDELAKKLEPNKKALETLRFKKMRYEEYEQTKIDLDQRFTMLSILRESLSATKGIPLLYSEVYLTSVKTIANDLLKMAFGGEFLIEDFDINDKEFNIEARRSDGEVLSDVSLASQGETSVLSLAISLAIIKKSMRKYNIQMFDEIDATLDSERRMQFVHIIEKMAEDLNIEQMFIISHNDCLDSSPLDMILLKGHTVDRDNVEYMSNKNVIFEL